MADAPCEMQIEPSAHDIEKAHFKNCHNRYKQRMWYIMPIVASSIMPIVASYKMVLVTHYDIS